MQTKKILIIFFYLYPLFSALNAEDMKLLGGDILEISVFEHKELSQKCMVTEKGAIKVALSGKYQVFNKSAEKLEKEIAEGFKKNSSYTNPKVIIRLYKTVPRKIYVHGYIREPQAVVVPYGQTISLRQLVAEVKGFKSGADIVHIEITRRLHSQKKQVKKILVNFLNLMSKNNLESFLLEPGDVIFVKELKNVQIVGAVVKPISFKPNPQIPLTFLKAISMAGGFKENSQRLFFSLERNGKTQIRPIVPVKKSKKESKIESVDEYLKLLNSQSEKYLQPGDTIRILTIEDVYVDGYVSAPGAFTIAQNRTITLRKLLALSRGTKEEADLSKIKILRNVNGVNKLFIKDLRKLGSKKSTPKTFIVLPGDFIYVPRSWL